LVTLLLSCGALAFMIFEIEKKATVLQEQLTSIEAENKRESNFYTLQKKSEESVEDRLVIEKYFLPQSSDSIDFLNRVEQLAPQSGVTLETEALEEATDKKTKQKYIEAKFSFSGTEENVEQFIEILESLPYMSRITAVSISQQAAGDWAAKVTMRVSILNYEV
jgi:Tfp pilus assembly protein PilO